MQFSSVVEESSLYLTETPKTRVLHHCLGQPAPEKGVEWWIGRDSLTRFKSFRINGVIRRSRMTGLFRYSVATGMQTKTFSRDRENIWFCHGVLCNREQCYFEWWRMLDEYSICWGWGGGKEEEEEDEEKRKKQEACFEFSFVSSAKKSLSFTWAMLNSQMPILSQFSWGCKGLVFI